MYYDKCSIFSHLFIYEYMTHAVASVIDNNYLL